MKYKKAMWLSGLVILIVACGFGVYRVRKVYFPTLPEVYEAHWGIDLPEDLKKVYDIKTPGSFHGDGWRYTVFQVAQKSFDMDGFLRGRADTSFAEGILEKLEVPLEQRPHFTENMIWNNMEKYNNMLFLLYDEEKELLYLFEELK